ncbi:DUF1217 domain-containing protein [Rhizobium sp. EC-SD404]|uniref:DUF1217 domain-containing protein n=1 Tax=Rhizobium sp. EC-SD404 TaxID=2038389 RepID=UPI0012565E34|nr:DUF1217 domain-containing protein [Rhizobium sp. EC-SD404]VVT22357.1 conserved hypothetical protein [Rhizobium sp. EC-SD404]
MLSTYLSYNLIDRDMSRSIGRVSDDAVVAREAQYYRETIGKISSVEEFLDDYRVYSYAMKAYGLEEMTYARAFMQQVLESDLSDEDSFANKLEDERYRTFAQAFSFAGNAAAQVKPDIQSDQQTEDLIGLYDVSVQNAGRVYAAEFENYKARIGQITNVDEFLADQRLVEVALQANVIDTQYYSASFLRDVLTSDLDDPTSFVNRPENSDYLSLAQAFNFQADGSLAAGVPAQDAEQVRKITEDYLFDVPDRIVPLAAELMTDYFNEKIATVASVDDLLADPRLVDYLWTSYDQPASLTRRADIRAALTSDLSDPTSFANTTQNGALRAMAGLFNFGTDGQATGPAQTAEQTTSLNRTFLANYDNAGERRDDTRESVFRAAMETVGTLDALMRDPSLYNYMMQAYGLDPVTESRDAVKRALTSDLTDPNSFANQPRNARFREIASAFNFGADGLPTTARRAQSESQFNAFTTDYMERAETLGLTSDEAAEEIRYYREQIAQVGSIDELLADERVVSILLQSQGYDPELIDARTLRDVLLSDVEDPESFVNTQPDRSLRLLAASFNFNPDGTIAREVAGNVQSVADIIQTEEFYLRQTLEEEAGLENEGVRLALYFKRMAGEINNAFDILADPALQQVVRIALGLPEEIAQSDIDAQARMIEDRLDIATLSDPRELDKFITQFSALYDMENSNFADPALTLFSGDAGSALGADMLSSLAQVSRRGF